MFTQIVPQLWMVIPKEERVLLAKEFGLVRTGVTEVVNEDVVTDGFTAEDLKAITQEKMNAYIGSEESFMRAWELTVMKAYSELNPPTIVIEAKAEVVKVEKEVEKVAEEIKEEVIKVEQTIKNKKGQKNV